MRDFYGELVVEPKPLAETEHRDLEKDKACLKSLPEGGTWSETCHIAEHAIYRAQVAEARLSALEESKP